MKPAARDWLAGLDAFSEVHRAPRPERRVPVPSEIAASVAAILRGHLEGKGLDDVTTALARNPDVAVVLTTTPEGFSAADDLAARLPPSDAARFVAVTESVYRAWCMRSADEGLHLHVNVWSWVKAPLPDRRRGEFSAWPVAPGTAYWLHRHGTRDSRGEVRAADLWAFDGTRATPLARGIAERAKRLG